jgi:hypothetical protein
MKRVELRRVAADVSACPGERYIVELFDERGGGRLVALGYALFRRDDGACEVSVVSRGTHDTSHAHAALLALLACVAHDGARAGAAAFSVTVAG